MLTPGLSDLLEPLSIVTPATHSINVLRNKRMVAVRQGKPIHVDRSLVAGISSQSEAHATSDRTALGLLQANQLSYDDVRAGDSAYAGLVQCWQCCGFHITLLVELNDLDGLHRYTDGDFAGN